MLSRRAMSYIKNRFNKGLILYFDRVYERLSGLWCKPYIRKYMFLFIENPALTRCVEIPPNFL